MDYKFLTSGQDSDTSLTESVNLLSSYKVLSKDALVSYKNYVPSLNWYALSSLLNYSFDSILKLRK